MKKMKQYWKRIVSAMFPFLLLAGMTACRSVEQIDVRQQALIEQKEMGSTVLEAFQKNDYPAFRKVCGDLISKKDFETALDTMKRQFGEIKEYQFVTALRTPAVQNDVWCVTFQRKGGNDKEIVQDLLFRFVTGNNENGRQVIGLAFL